MRFSFPPRFSFLTWLGRHEFAFFAWLAVLFGGAYVFVEVADEVGEGETRSIDQALLLALRNPADLSDPIGPAWLEELGRDFTALGGVGVLTLLTLGVLGYLILCGRYRGALFTFVAITGGLLLSTLLKMNFDRARPDLVSHESFVYTASFPSGHSMMSALTYLTLAALLSTVQQKRRLKAFLLLIAVFLTVLVGLSRVYLGVHWPTDVLAGWAAGAAWAGLCWTVVHYMQRKGVVESPPKQSEDE